MSMHTRKHTGLKRLCWAAGTATLCWAGSASASESLPRERLFEAAASVLKIEVVRQQGGYSLGSGVVVAPERVVTSCHVTQPGTRINVLKGDQRWQADAQLRSGVHDLCLLRVPGLEATPVSLGSSVQLQPGQPVHAVGFTGGLGLQNSSGRVIELHRHEGARVIQSDNWFSSGASGGALFDGDLRLVGILTFRLRGGALHYFSSPVEWALPLIAARDELQPIGPAPASEPWYWRSPPPGQPRFLHAAALQREGKWQELETLARSWSEADRDDPAPWNALARALQALGRLPEAARALEQSLRLAPELASTLLQRGQLALQMGDSRRALEIKRRLDTLDPLLAAEFVVPGGPR